MKRFALTLLAATAFLAAPILAGEKEAIESFKKDVTALKAWTDEQDKAVAENPLAGFGMFDQMMAKLKAVKTDDLPADLLEAWKGLVGGVEKMSVLVNQFPKKPEEIQAFMTKKMAEDPKFMEEFGKKMEAIGEEMKPVTEKMKEAAKKYGIEGLEKLGPKG